MKKPPPLLTPRIIADLRAGDECGDPDHPGLRVRRTNAARVFWLTKGRPVNRYATQHDGKPAYVVADNGCGFDMRYADKLFRPFQKPDGGRFDGSGIGLATVRSIVQRHGGHVWAQSRLAEGARFYFTLDSCPELR